jgi:hypothetical protein
MKKVKM